MTLDEFSYIEQLEAHLKMAALNLDNPSLVHAIYSLLNTSPITKILNENTNKD